MGRHIGAIVFFLALDFLAYGKQQTYLIELNPDPLLEQPEVLKAAQESGPSQPLDWHSDLIKKELQAITNLQYSILNQCSQVLGRPIQPVHLYSLAFSGAAVKLDPKEVKELEGMKGIKRIIKDPIYHLHTDRGPLLIGAGEVWPESATGGGSTGFNYQGEGTIVGIIDTGINTSSRSFQDTGDDAYPHVNPYGPETYVGDCLEKPELCNPKLIGVRSYPEITKAYQDPVFPEDHHRPLDGRDYNGHGSHTAGTAAGNVLLDVPHLLSQPLVQSTGLETGFRFNRISGVAPHANIISYQVCYPGSFGDPFSACPGSVTLQAIEHAIEDGVDVINFSIGGGRNPWQDPVELAFLRASAAGIVVVASAGNAGPGPETTSHAGPWLLSVAAATHGRSIEFSKEIVDFSGGQEPPTTPITGVSMSGEITGPVVYAGNYDNGTDNPEQCLQPFPEGTFQGQIVACERGAIARVAKIQHIAAGGAGGGILMNTDDSTIVADPYVIPGIHISLADATVLKAWLAEGSDHQAKITAASPERVIKEGESLAGFSSRGPHPTLSLLSPRITGPGVDIYAAYSTDNPFSPNSGPNTADFSMLSGTSMSSPHVAGAALLLKGLHPSWSPYEIISAMQLTADPSVLLEDGSTRAGIPQMGTGSIRIHQAAQVGFVLPQSPEDYQTANPKEGGSPEGLNTVGLVQQQCFVACEFTRTLMSTGPGEWRIAIASAGLDVETVPRSITFRGAGERLDVSIKVTPRDGQLGWQEGRLTLTEQSGLYPRANLPLLVNSVDQILPERLAISSEQRLLGYHKESGLYLKPQPGIHATPYGLTAGESQQGMIETDPTNDNPFDEGGRHVAFHTIEPGTKRLYAGIGETLATDLDLFIGIDTNQDRMASRDEIICASTKASSQESCDLLNPTVGTYWVLTHGWATGSDAPVAFETIVAKIHHGDNLMVYMDPVVDHKTPTDLWMVWWNEPKRKLFGAIAIQNQEGKELGLIPLDIEGPSLSSIRDLSF